MQRLFGTDGIRGVAESYPLDPVTLYRLGRELVRKGKGRVLIGRDTRESGLWIEAVLERAIRESGGNPTLAGVITTPGIAHLTGRFGFDAGIMISASHNPFQDNGIKIFSGSGLKLSDEEEIGIEGVLLAQSASPPVSLRHPVETERPLVCFDPTCVDAYLEHLCRVPGRTRLKHLKVVVDCANGAGVFAAAEAFRRLGAEVRAIHARPDGRNINSECGSLFPDSMSRAVRNGGAHLGVALDGDGDRVVLADEKGAILDGDHVLYVLARYLLPRGGLPSGALVATVMSNLGLDLALKPEGIHVVRTRVGDRYVLEEMLRGGCWLGGEQSGHVIIREHSPAGDGIQTALKIAQVMREEGLPLSRLAAGLHKLPQVVLNVRVREKRDLDTLDDVRMAVEETRQRLGERGRVLVRYSGTEFLARIMVEGEREEEVQEHARRIAGRIEAHLGAAPPKWPQ